MPGPSGSLTRLTVATLLLIGAAVVPGHAAERVGAAFRIVNEVGGDGVVGKRRLADADEVYRDEAITARPASRGELQLADGSRIIVGENSTIRLDDFVVGSGGFRSGTISIAKGAFRFISGSSRRGAIRIRTPVSSIGIRGTAFDVHVGPGGITRILLMNGQITACANGGACLQLNRACDVVEIGGPGSITRLPFLRSANSPRPREATFFPLMEAQGRHSLPWQLLEIPCNARAAAENLGNTRGDGPGGAPEAPFGNSPDSGSDSGTDGGSGGSEGGTDGGIGL